MEVGTRKGERVGPMTSSEPLSFLSVEEGRRKMRSKRGEGRKGTYAGTPSLSPVDRYKWRVLTGV